MKISFYKVALKKRFPLAISRGIRYNSENLFIRYEKDGCVGWGEAAPGKTEGADTPEAVQEALEKFIATGIDGVSIQALYDRARALEVPPCAYVGLLLKSFLARSTNIMCSEFSLGSLANSVAVM